MVEQEELSKGLFKHVKIHQREGQLSSSLSDEELYSSVKNFITVRHEILDP